MADPITGSRDGSWVFLVLDDDEDSRFLVRRDLQRGFPVAQIVECRSPAEANAAMARLRFDAVITDHHLCIATGTEVIARMRAAGLTHLVVMVTGSIDPSVHLEALASGAARVFRSGDPELIVFLREALRR